MNALLQRIIDAVNSLAGGKVPTPNPINASSGLKCWVGVSEGKLCDIEWKIRPDGTRFGKCKRCGNWAGLRPTYFEEQHRYAELRKREENKREPEHEEYEQWLSRHQGLVKKFLEVADRKVSTLDDYGDENWDALPKEIQRCLLKIAHTEQASNVTEKTLKDAWEKGYDWALKDWMVLPKYKWINARLESEFRKFHNRRAQAQNAEPEFDEFSGTEFETYIARLLKQNGFENIRGTAGSGDQGGYLLATKADRTIVIQAKRYRGSVGNKAVQEVVAAVKFYSADEGWVVTNSTFTASAKALANANSVRLIDGYELRNGSLR